MERRLGERASTPVKLTALTATCAGRENAFELCKRYVIQQTRQPDQWLVLDGPEPMHTKVADAIAAGRIEGDAIIFAEDDDYLKPGWFAWCEDRILRGYQVVGQGRAIYYNPVHRWWSNCNNVRHASLCQTAIAKEMLPVVYNIIDDFGCPWIDVQLWNVECNKYLDLPKESEALVIGIKGICGPKAYSREHRQMNGQDNETDYDLSKLRSLIGEDARYYEHYFSGEDEILKLAGAFPI